ncbi:MAG: WS/DGAT domain-containing protein, partial [Actinomycetota bacterium]
WEVWVLDGFSGGRLAVLTKQHLAAVDDRVGDAMAVAAFDLEPDAPVDPVEPWSPEPQPSEVDLAGRGVASRLRRPRLLADAAIDLARRRDARPPRPVPPVFTGALTSARSVALTTLPLGEVRAIKDHHDVTVNDVVLAVCAGALRSALSEAGTLPEDPLLALVPVSVAGDLDGDATDHVSSVISSLATDTRDPALRIQVIHDATREARRRKAIRARRLRDWTEFAAPAVLGQAGRVAVQAVRDAAGAPANLIVANVPGPTAQLYFAGAPVRDLFFFGPLATGVPLGVSVVSAGDRMEMALVACPGVGPDVDDLARHVDGALAELLSTLPASDAVLEPKPPPSSGESPEDPGPLPSDVVEDVRATLERSRQTREQAGRLTDLLGTDGDASSEA